MRLKLATALFLAVIACSSPGSESPTPRPGNPDVYARIEATTDCAQLQKDFDTAAQNHDRDSNAGRLEQAKWSTGYMAAADARMEELGCYKSSP